MPFVMFMCAVCDATCTIRASSQGPLGVDYGVAVYVDTPGTGWRYVRDKWFCSIKCDRNNKVADLHREIDNLRAKIAELENPPCP